MIKEYYEEEFYDPDNPFDRKYKSWWINIVGNFRVMHVNEFAYYLKEKYSIELEYSKRIVWFPDEETQIRFLLEWA